MRTKTLEYIESENARAKTEEVKTLNERALTHFDAKIWESFITGTFPGKEGGLRSVQ